MDSFIVHIYPESLLMKTPLIRVQVTGNDKIDLLKPTLNVHESHHGRTAEIICTNHRKTSPYCLSKSEQS